MHDGGGPPEMPWRLGRIAHLFPDHPVGIARMAAFLLGCR